LLQKNDQGEEQPIDFMSKVLKDAKLNVKDILSQQYCLGTRGKWVANI
jgi:hypothetical protein